MWSNFLCVRIVSRLPLVILWPVQLTLCCFIHSSAETVEQYDNGQGSAQAAEYMTLPAELEQVSSSQHATQDGFHGSSIGQQPLDPAGSTDPPVDSAALLMSVPDTTPFGAATLRSQNPRSLLSANGLAPFLATNLQPAKARCRGCLNALLYSFGAFVWIALFWVMQWKEHM